MGGGQSGRGYHVHLDAHGTKQPGEQLLLVNWGRVGLRPLKGGREERS